MSQKRATKIHVAVESLVAQINSQCKLATLRRENPRNLTRKQNL
jgi:hypothetical protein